MEEKATQYAVKSQARKKLIPIASKSLNSSNKENELSNDSLKSSKDFIPSAKHTLIKRSFGQTIKHSIKKSNQLNVKQELMNSVNGQCSNSFHRNNKHKSSIKFDLKESSIANLRKDSSLKSLKDKSSAKQHERTLAISKEKLKKQLSTISLKILDNSDSLGSIKSISDKIPLIPLSSNNAFLKHCIPLPHKKKTTIHITSQSKSEHTTKKSQSSGSSDAHPNFDPQFVEEYRGEIYMNLISEEKSRVHPINPDYLLNQRKEIDSNMRSILINWLIEVHDKFSYSTESLFLTVSIIDRYLSLKSTTRAKFQLLGIAALFIACKHEEIELPSPKEFVYITDKAFTQKELFQMEYKVLQALDFAVLLPTSNRFYQYLSVEFKLNNQQSLLGLYLLHCCLLDYALLKYSYSEIAWCCLHLAMKHFHIEGSDKCFKKSLINESSCCSLKECINVIALCVDTVGTSEWKASKRKFQQEKYSRVAYLLEDKALCK